VTPGARLLLSPRWLVGHLLALGLIVLFVNFGLWQLRRLDQRVERNTLIEARMAAEPQPLALLRERFGEEPEGLAFRRAVAEGRYEPSGEILLRSRSRDGQAGWHVLTPLVGESGRALLVNRGWVPYALDNPPVEKASPPEGTVTVEGIVRPEEDPPEGWLARFAPRDPPEGPLRKSFYVDVERFAAQLPYPLEPVYLQLTGQEPAGERTLPLAPRPPELDRGTHLSYALQWFSFALIGLVGYLLLLRRTARAAH
jgi:surfeit locus 1 family protein